MTYKALIEKLQNLTLEQLEDDVTIYVAEDDEFYPVFDLDVSGQDSPSDGILDEGHIFLPI